MKKEEAIKIIEYTFLNADGHLKPLDFDYGGGKGIVEALRMAIEALSKPSLPPNLDDAAEKYSENILANNEDLQDAIEDAFKAGAEWMSLQSTRTRLAVKSNTPEGKDAYEKVAKEMRASVAAKDYGEDIYCPILKHKNKTGLNCTAVEDAFLKGAEWMAGQGETVEGVFKAGDPGYPDVRMGEQYSIEHILRKPGGIEPGDEVLVQIRKK